MYRQPSDHLVPNPPPPPPRDVPMRGLTPQVSALNISTACITALKKKLDTRGVDHYLLSTRDILLHTVFDRAKLLTTAGQSSSISEITRPRYVKEVTISRGRP